jgi:hypothetical protein
MGVIGIQTDLIEKWWNWNGKQPPISHSFLMFVCATIFYVCVCFNKLFV